MLSSAITLLLTLVVAQTGQQVPVDAKDLVGTYHYSTGFHVIKLELRPKGLVKAATWSDDGSGNAEWSGTWKFGDDVVTTEDSTWGRYEWVPMVWGDRFLLVEKLELMEGRTKVKLLQEVDKIHKMGERGEDPDTLTVLTRVPEGAKVLPKRYGKITAPKRFQKYVEGIDLKWPHPIRKLSHPLSDG